MEYGDWNNSYMGYGQGTIGGGNPELEKWAVKEARRCFSRVGLIYVIFLGASYLSQWLTVMSMVWTGLIDKISDNMYMMISMLGMYPLAVPLTGLLMRLVPAKGKPEGERWGLGKLSCFFIVSLGVLEVGNLLGSVLMAIAGVIKGESIANDVNDLILSMEPWTILVTAVIIAPIMEELVFRKFLLDRIAGYGHWTAMMVSGVLFGIVHGNFYQFFYAFGLGVIFAYIYLHTGRITYTISFHMLINFTGSIIPLGIMKLLEIHALIGVLITLCNLMLMLGFIICAIVLMVCFWKDLTFSPAIDGIRSGKRARAVWLNVGMILFLLCGGGLFIISL